MVEEKTDVENLWSQALDILRESISESEYSTWFSRVYFGSAKGNTVTLYVPGGSCPCRKLPSVEETLVLATSVP